MPDNIRDPVTFDERLTTVEVAVSHMSEKIDSLAKILEKNQGTNWSAIGVILMGLATVATYWIAPVMKQTEYNAIESEQIRQDLVAIRQNFRAHEQLDGHPTALEISRRLREDLDSLEERFHSKHGQ